MGKLSIIGTPIGNLEDITLRALRTLKEAAVILCEDTRTTKKLLDKYSITGKKLLSYHAHSTKNQESLIIQMLKEGKHLALVSDAGTPTISDPGVLLVRTIKDTCGKEVAIEGIPGPSALITALSVSGITSATFVFLGFIPQKKGRQTWMRSVVNEPRTIVCYESSHRITKALAQLDEVLGDTRKVLIARELTKIHEEVLEGAAKEVLQQLLDTPVKQKGEFVLIIAPN